MPVYCLCSGAHCLLLAARRPVQVDWESILSPHFHLFNASVSPWFYNSSALQPAPFHLPIVQEVLPTTFHVFAALSYDGGDEA